jgi:CubicO group peptidase (beta-lactamase class C family)
MIVFMTLAPKKVKTPKEVQNIEELETFFEELVQTENPSSLNFVVVKNGEVIYDKAFGFADAPNGIPATTETVYHWWSTTKVFTAVAIMQLNEQGLLNLDDAVVEYLPFFEVQYPSENSIPVTIRHLLNHSSGLPDNVPAVVGWMHYEGQPAKDQMDLLREVLPNYAKLKFEPGEKSAYTNVGYMVLGAVIEEVSGESYEDYVCNHILAPLQMQQTDFVYTESMQSNAAVGMHPLLDIQSAFLPFFYGGRMDGLVREVKDGKLWFHRVLSDSTPPTGLIGPAADMARFEVAYLNGGILDGVRILSDESVAYMSIQNWISARSQQMDQRIQGTGWEICGTEALCLVHGGGGPGYGSAIRLLPDQQIGFVLLANSTNIDREGIMDLAMRLDW